MKSRWVQPRWKVGIVETSLAEMVAGERLRVRYPANPFTDRWFADPFVLSVDGDEVTLLVEDFRYADQTGRISRIIVDLDRMSIVSCKVILSGGHFSFPAIWRKDGKVYVYPEQSRQGRLELFEYDVAKETCRLVAGLSEEPLVDAIIYQDALYSTCMPDPNGKVLGVSPLSLQPSQRPAASLSQESGLAGMPSAGERWVFDECIARNAGDFFAVDDAVYRPAQECNRWYGHAVSIQRFEGGRFTEVRRIPGIHTLNSYHGVTVVDRKVFPFKWLYWLLRRSDL